MHVRVLDRTDTSPWHICKVFEHQTLVHNVLARFRMYTVMSSHVVTLLLYANIADASDALDADDISRPTSQPTWRRRDAYTL